MTKKSILFIACIITTIFVKAQNAASIDSLAGFDYKEFQHHLDAFKGTETQKAAYIARVKRRFIAKKYAPATNHRIINPQSTQAYDCTNIGFDDGTTTGWTISGNSLATGTGTTTVGDFLVTSGTGTDPYGNFPVVFAGTNSLRLSSDNISTTSFSSSAERIIAVTPANAYFYLSFAMDILEYPHPQSASAKFVVNFYNGAGALIPCPQYDCTYYQGSTGTGTSVGVSNFQQTACTASGGSCAGAGNCGSNIGSQCYPVTYAPWQTVNMDLTPYMGQNVTCQIICEWCIYDYDWAYCYIDAACSPSLITASNALCTGGSTILSGPSGMTSYSWTPPPGNSPSTSSTSSINATVPGTYTLTANLNACSTTAYTYTYNLTQISATSPTVSIVASNDSICSGATTTLTASGANTYTWSTSAVANSISVSPANSSTYIVTGIDTASGCAGSATQVVYINGAISITAVNNPLCSGTTATLTASGATTYTWSSNAGSLITNSVAVSPTVNTTYTVTGTDITHGCTSSTTQMVYVASNLVLSNPHDSVCSGISVTLTASGATSYTWSTGATSANITVTPTITTSYTVTGANACINTGTTSIKVNPSPTLTVSTTTPICEGTAATLIASGANTYSWNTGATTSSIMVTPTITTTYTVTGTNPNGCKNTDTLSVVVINCTTGISQLTNNSSQISIYPNPNNGSFVIETNSTTKQTIQLYDVNGKMVLTQIISGKTNIDASNLSEGVYNISIIRNEGIVNKRLVIVR